MASISNCISRLLWGSLLDHFKVDNVLIANQSISLFLALTIRFTVNSKFFFGLHLQLVLLCYGGAFSMMPTLSTFIFGKKLGP
jgi:hypothetical protein